jgi:acyl-coenzyme A synthetase/AMP-(fatty) acid ligase
MRRELWALELADMSPTDQSVLRDNSHLSIQDTEEVLSLHPAVRDCVVLEMSHLPHGKDLFAFISLRAELTGREQELREWVHCKIDACNALERIVILQDLPKEPSGKVDRAALQDLAVSLGNGIEFVN